VNERWFRASRNQVAVRGESIKGGMTGTWAVKTKGSDCMEKEPKPEANGVKHHIGRMEGWGGDQKRKGGGKGKNKKKAN